MKKFANTAICFILGSIIASLTNVSNDIELMQTASTGEGKECTISGTSGPNTLVGTDSNDMICGFDGVDFIEALGGNDTL